ncbi:hypothetical protein PIG65_08335 [Enterobacter sp. FR 78]|mgnify:CR=1 FL=1|uniref:hypothetical protein n=1 Tax=Enterobacter sp. FR 78 TaxID=3021714 RepID=UPI0023A93A6C|nr:hypothetical protein [Enterobacter sp. FR 78]MDD9578529.1 hypothetical protein [Enterobacter sp. FR 78]
MAAIATYLPESQIITLTKDFPALEDPQNPIGFTNPTQFAFFFHEWIHFLHNISTIHGFSVFCSQLILWNNFRWTMENKDTSLGSSHINPKLIENNKIHFNFIISNRKRNLCTLPDYAKNKDILFDAHEIEPLKYADGQVTCTSLIKCKVTFNDNSYDLHIGLLEILESVAYMLESKCAQEMNSTPQESPFYPYHTVSGLAKKVASSLTDDDLICCMLASLQSNDSPRVLMNLLIEMESLEADCRYEKLVSHVKKQLNELAEATDSSINQIINLFPVDEPMGNFIKLTLRRIKNNLGFRIEDPFLELNIIKKISKKPLEMNDIIRKFGGCTIIQKRNNDPEIPECDVMYDFELPENDESTLFGSKKLHACFHFILLHYRPSGEIVKTENLTNSSRSRCPFYTVCGESLRVSNSEICNSKPWKSMSCASNQGCYYAAAMIATNPPSNSN